MMANFQLGELYRELHRYNKALQAYETTIGYCEAQTATIEQMKMFLTHLGFDLKAVVTSNITQTDLPTHKISGQRNCLTYHRESVTFYMPVICFYSCQWGWWARRSVHYDQTGVFRKYSDGFTESDAHRAYKHCKPVNACYSTDDS